MYRLQDRFRCHAHDNVRGGHRGELVGVPTSPTSGRASEYAERWYRWWRPCGGGLSERGY